MSRRYWYFYSGTGDETNPINYARLSINPNQCGVGQSICTIYGLPNAVNPTIPQAAELSGTLQNYITSARLISNEYPVFPQKPYVYLKSP